MYVFSPYQSSFIALPVPKEKTHTMDRLTRTPGVQWELLVALIACVRPLPLATSWRVRTIQNVCVRACVHTQERVQHQLT